MAGPVVSHRRTVIAARWGGSRPDRRPKRDDAPSALAGSAALRLCRARSSLPRPDGPAVRPSSGCHPEPDGRGRHALRRALRRSRPARDRRGRADPGARRNARQPGRPRLCTRPPRRFTVICLRPDPDNTAREARAIRRVGPDRPGLPAGQPSRCCSAGCCAGRAALAGCRRGPVLRRAGLGAARCNRLGWEMPAVTLWVFAAGGLALSTPPTSQAPVESSGASRLVRVPAGLACLLLLLPPLAILRSEAPMRAARRALARGDCPPPSPAPSTPRQH